MSFGDLIAQAEPAPLPEEPPVDHLIALDMLVDRVLRGEVPGVRLVRMDYAFDERLLAYHERPTFRVQAPSRRVPA